MFYLIQSEYVIFLALCCLLFLLVRRPLRHQRYLADLLRWYYQSRASTAFVLRNGELDEISADDLVMGDIVHVSEVSRPTMAM
jgi:magnesium-transporting ATPase (P-type)